MSKSGLAETEKLRQNLTEQLDRVVRQLAEIEDYKYLKLVFYADVKFLSFLNIFRADLSPGEYETMKEESKQQLIEFSSTLSKMTAGNMSLVDELSAMKMAVQAAISEAFKTPEIIGLFARKQPAQLRMKLEELERDKKIGHMQEQTYIERKLEMLTALKKLNDTLSLNEEEFLNAHSTDAMTNFEAASSKQTASDKVLNLVDKIQK